MQEPSFAGDETLAPARAGEGTRGTGASARSDPASGVVVGGASGTGPGAAANASAATASRSGSGSACGSGSGSAAAASRAAASRSASSRSASSCSGSVGLRLLGRRRRRRRLLGRRRVGRRRLRRCRLGLRLGHRDGRGADRRTWRCHLPVREQQLLGRRRHRAAVVVRRDPLELGARRLGERQVGAVEQLAEAHDGPAAPPAAVVGELAQELGVERRGGRPVRVPGEQELALLLGRREQRRHVRRACPHRLVDVVVELVDGDPAVAVAVGCAGREALDDRAREDRRRPLARQLPVLERVLERVRGGHDHPPASHQIGGAGARAAARQHPAADRAGVAAVERDDDALRHAALHQARQPRRGDRRRLEVVENPCPGSRSRARRPRRGCRGTRGGGAGGRRGRAP